VLCALIVFGSVLVLANALGPWQDRAHVSSGRQSFACVVCDRCKPLQGQRPTCKLRYHS
jgi:hypothetical protein